MNFHHFHQFWEKNPALYYGLACLFGVALSLKFSWILFLPLSLVIINQPIKILLFSIIFFSAFTYTTFSYDFPDIPPEGITGKASIEISSIRLKKTFYGKQWTYKGRIKSFENIGKNLDFTLNLPFDETITRPPANQHYEVLATLKYSQNGQYFLKVSKNTPWLPIPNTFSLAEWRYQMKTLVTEYIKNHYSSPRAAAFLSGIATGEFDERSMSQEFAQFGLQHIMAISGFHFAIIAAILSSVFKFFLPKRQKIWILIGLLSVYFLFLGCGPSILRAWIAIVLALIGAWFGREGSGLNALGVGLMIVLIADPLLCTHMGFQFSFMTTAAILILFRVLDERTKKIFYHRPLALTSLMTRWDQHGYCLLTTIRQAASLGLAVNLAALPLTLYYFQSFPYLSLLYNLFFPFLVSFSMLFLLMGSVIPGMHALNNAYTSFVLNFTHQMPNKASFLIETSQVSLEGLLVYLTVLFAIGIVYQNLISKRSESEFIYL